MKKLFFVLVMASLLLAACGGGATEAPAASNEPVEIRVWGHQAPASNEANQKMFDDFMAANPNVTIKYETFPWDVFT